jgi:hypothetical protein
MKIHLPLKLNVNVYAVLINEKMENIFGLII